MQIFNIKNCCESRLVSVSKRGHVSLKEVSVNRGSVRTVPYGNWDFFSCSSSLLQTKCHVVTLMLLFTIVV